jgi:hypothetical protein
MSKEIVATNNEVLSNFEKKGTLRKSSLAQVRHRVETPPIIAYHV